MNFSKLTLKNMVFYGYHGAYAAEKELGQRIEIDIDLFTDFAKAGKLDNLDATINYVEIYRIVKEIVETGSYDLIETIATTIHEQIRERYNPEKILVRVRKPQPPVGGLIETVEFEFSSERD